MILATALFLASAFLCRLVWYKRFIQYDGFPQLPSSLLLGHWKIYHSIMQRGSLGRDYDHIFSEIHDMLGRPHLVLMDFRPLSRPVVFIASHEIAEQISRPTKLFPTSIPRVDLGHMKPVIGQTSILSAEGDEWKSLRKTFNPLFARQNLLTLLPTILDKTMLFVNHLDRLSESKAEVSLVSLITRLIYDIMGATVLDIDLDAQHSDQGQQGELVRAFTKLIGAYLDHKINLPWWFNPAGELKRRRLGQRVDSLLKSTIRRRHEERQQQRYYGKGKKQAQSPRLSSSIISLSLQDADTQVLSEDLVNQTCDQVRTFLVAGRDPPSVTLAWVFYEISRTPRVQAAIQAELDVLFGPGTDADAVRSGLASPAGPNLLNGMVYIAAVLKETLRLHTPASTARYSPAGSGLVVTMPTGEKLDLDGVVIYNCDSIIHRDPAVFGPMADYFMPERWLDDKPDRTKTAIPPSAWRPFERGPRACIGQEFATIQMQVIVAVVARQYEFTKVGLGALALDERTGRPVLGADGQYETQSHVYNVSLSCFLPKYSVCLTV
ncbi:cytochrome P450 [Aspergillus californicus]